MHAADDLPADIQAQINERRTALDQTVDMDYEATLAAKLSIARRIFDAQGGTTLESADFKAFCAQNWEWLRPYAVFCFLRDLFGTAEHWRWGALGEPTDEVRIQRAGAYTYGPRQLSTSCPRVTGVGPHRQP